MAGKQLGETLARPGDRCMSAVRELETVLPMVASNSMLRYEAFTRLFALLGSMPDSDTIEIIQTGLGGLEWEQLSEEDRVRFAEHLRHLADQVLPVSVRTELVSVASQTPSSGAGESLITPEPAAKPEPVLPAAEIAYDSGRFGDQSRLVEALKEQPEDVSVDQLLNTMAGGFGGQH
ncbi:hypothetical protein [Marinobacter sp. F4216]|uniref:hypothetical protein n=1 Tax=Marinobacter sp. F4216 TaxID=2874281 RepID=UPI001CBB7AD5|nr:hypothetical protein [Marinobacter sp. F4216]MBZ2167334.1 hypothetical protein [Marinobacter sp. F4216]